MAEVATSSSSGAFTEHSAFAALRRACQEVGLRADSAELIRMGSNAVFRVNAETIARVAPSLAHQKNTQKQIDVARWLASIDYPAVRATEVPQPVPAEGRVVTFWESVSSKTVYAPIADVATLIKRLHSLEAPSSLKLPPLRPFGAGTDPLPDFPGLPPSDAQYLRARIAWARSAFTSLPFVLPAGVVHGDANVGNVLLDDCANPVLIDLDSFAIGPREWDLIQTALFYDRLGWHTREEYQTFEAALAAEADVDQHHVLTCANWPLSSSSSSSQIGGDCGCCRAAADRY
jgi:hypothetical protein